MIKSFLNNFLKKEEATPKLQINESIYQELIDLAVDSIIVGDSNGNIIYANTATLNLFNVPLSKILNIHISKLSWEPESISNAPFRFDLVNAGKTIRNIRTICKPDKTECIVEMSSKLMASGNYQSILRDITEQKQAQTSLIQSEEKYRRLFDNSSLGVFQSTVEGKAISVNQAFLDMFGYDSPEDFMQKVKNVGTDIFADPNRRNEIIQLMAKNPELKTFENIYRRKDGSTFVGNLHAMPVKDSNGKVIIMEGIIEDVTERKEAQVAIKQSETKYRQLFDNMTAGFALHEMIYDETGKPSDYTYIAVNPAFEKLINTKAQNLIGKTVKEIMPQTEQYWIDTYDKVVRTGEPISYENYAQEIGRYFHVRAFSTEKNIFAVMATDITERIEAKNSLLLRESHLKAIIENQERLVWLKNEKGKFLSVNQAFATSCGIDNPDMLIGKTDFDIWPKELAKKYIEDDTNIMKTGQSTIIEEQIFDKGETRWFETFKKPVFNKNGEIVGTTGYARDITEKKKEENALIQEKRLFEYVVESLPVMLFLKDAKDLKFALMNRTGEKLLGITKEELIGKNDYDFFPKEQAEFFIKKDRETLAKKENVDISEEPIQTKDKGERILRTLKVPVINKSGDAEFLLGFSIDITDQKNAEKEHEKLQSQLAQSQKMESVGQLAGGIAHDFNNMLGVILGQTELALKKTNSTNPIFLSLIEIKNAAQRSAGLTKQLLTFARKQTMSPKILDLNKTILEMISLLKSLVGENILLTWVPNKAVGTIKIDPSQLDQIIANLCINAKEAIKSSGEITIKTDIVCFDEKFCKENTDYLPGNYVQLIIADNGRGMNKETISKIFEPFFTTKGLGKGTGLGLSTVYGIVKQNHGFITVTSTPGTGTIFNINLPKNTDEISGNTKETKILKTTETISDKKTILLVEDEPMVREMTIGMLELQGHTVIPAESAEEAIKIIQSKPMIDLLITDLIMPKMNGRELSKKILSIYPKLKCLFMSGYTSDVIAKHGVLEDNIHFIEKPFTIDTLNTKIREALE